MKKIIIAICCVLLLTTAAYTKEQESQKFSAIITMEYNGKSLEELAEIEKRIKVEFEEADSIKIDLNKTTNALPQSYEVEFIDSTLLYNGSSNITLVPGKIR